MIKPDLCAFFGVDYIKNCFTIHSAVKFFEGKKELKGLLDTDAPGTQRPSAQTEKPFVVCVVEVDVKLVWKDKLDPPAPESFAAPAFA